MDQGVPLGMEGGLGAGHIVKMGTQLPQGAQQLPKAYGRIVDGDGRFNRIGVGGRKHKFNRIRQMATMCPTICAHWRHLENTIELVLPSAHTESTTQIANRSVQLFLHGSRQKASIFYNGRPFPQKISPSHGDLNPM